MALTLSQLAAQLDAIDKAIGLGVTLVQHGDTRVQYRSVAELRSARGAIEQQISALGGATVTRTFKLTSSKDL